MSDLSPLSGRERTSPTLPDRFIERPIDGRSANAERLSDSRGADALLLERPHLRNIHTWLAALIDAGGLCFRDTFQLTFFAEVGLELSENAQHVEERLPRSSACVYRLLGGLEVDGDLLYVYAKDEKTAAEMEDSFALHISIIATDILKREIGIVLVSPKQLSQ